MAEQLITYQIVIATFLIFNYTVVFNQTQIFQDENSNKQFTVT